MKEQTTGVPAELFFFFFPPAPVACGSSLVPWPRIESAPQQKPEPQ